MAGPAVGTPLRVIRLREDSWGRVRFEVDDAHARLLGERGGQHVLVDCAEADQEAAEWRAPTTQLLLGQGQGQIVLVDQRSSDEELADAQG